MVLKKMAAAAVVVVGCLFTMLPAMAFDAAAEEKERFGGVQSLEDRIQRLEEAIGRDVEGDKWYDRIQFSGLVEVEVGYTETDDDDPAIADETESTVDLATVEWWLMPISPITSKGT